MSDNTILITQNSPAIIKEAPADNSFFPGNLVTYTATGKIDAGGDTLASVRVATENIAAQGTVDRAYERNETASFATPQRGEEVLLRVAPGTLAIAAYAGLEGLADGTVQTLAVGTQLAIALEAVDNSGGGSSVFIKAEVV